jgi:hypothetical protein
MLSQLTTGGGGDDDNDTVVAVIVLLILLLPHIALAHWHNKIRQIHTHV